MSASLPALERRPGLTDWRPAVSRNVDLSCASYTEYCEKVGAGGGVGDAEAAEIVGEGENMAGENLGNKGRGQRGRGKGKGGKDGKNEDSGAQKRGRLLETHWPPANAKQLGLERW